MGLFKLKKGKFSKKRSRSLKRNNSVGDQKSAEFREFYWMSEESRILLFRDQNKGTWGTSYIPPVKKKVKNKSESRDIKRAIFRIDLSLQPSDGLLCFFDESLTSTNFVSNSYFYPVCPLRGPPFIIPNPDSKAQVRGPELSPPRSSIAST